jgi:CheY-like chemotaxis protein
VFRFRLDFPKGFALLMGKKKMSSKPGLAVSSQRTNRRVSLSWKPTILIAEDSADSREMMELLLQMKGYEVLAVGNGIQALEVAVKEKPDAILLDLQLPVMDGLSVTRNVRMHAALRNMPIIIISGHDPNSYRQLAIEAGCDDYLLKPVNFDSLQTVLDRLVPRDRRGERRARFKCA